VSYTPSDAALLWMTPRRDVNKGWRHSCSINAHFSVSSSWDLLTKTLSSVVRQLSDHDCRNDSAQYYAAEVRQPDVGHQKHRQENSSGKKQESLTNAKVSARQPRYIRRNSLNRPSLRNAQQYQRRLYIVKKYFQCATIPSPKMRVSLHSFSRCCLPKMRSSENFRENSDL